MELDELQGDGIKIEKIFLGPNADQNNNYNRSMLSGMDDISDSYYEMPNDQTFSIVAFLGVIFAPFITERTLTQAA